MIIDMHSHFFPTLNRHEAEAFDATFPWLRDNHDGTGNIMRGDDVFRPVTEVLWDPVKRIEALDQQGVDVQIVSSTPVLFAYQAPAEQARAVARLVNDRALEFCATDPERLKTLCQVPLQELSFACDELDRAMSGGHLGVQIGNHVGDRDLDDGQLIEFLQHCARHQVPVLVHPWDMMARERMDRYMLQWLVGMPAETQLSILYLILSGGFERLPRTLKICFAHGGGSFAFLLGRVDNAWRQRELVSRDCPELPSSYIDRFFTDSAVFDHGALSLLVETMGDERILFGTDQPFPLGEQVPGELVKTHPHLSGSQKNGLLGGNAAGFFGLPPIDKKHD